jgi:hypothetical protein
MATPVLLYGSENWALNRADKKRIEMAEMKFLRKVAGHTLQDEISNLTIRNELQVFSIGGVIANQKQNWHEHLARMNPCLAAGQAVTYKPVRGRDIRRPRRRWAYDL